MATDFLTSYDYYSSRRDMEVITNIVDALKKILEEDKLQPQPLFLRTSENLILNIARKVVQEKKKTGKMRLYFVETKRKRQQISIG